MKKFLLLTILLFGFNCTDYLKDGNVVVTKVKKGREKYKYRVYLHSEMNDIVFYTNQKFLPGDKLKLVKEE